VWFLLVMIGSEGGLLQSLVAIESSTNKGEKTSEHIESAR
jgi:hypothetical protein